MATAKHTLSGIYKIANIVNGKVYIGSSADTQKRMRQHISRLRSKKHENAKLQRAWDSHGEDQFSFSVIEFVDNPQSLLSREQFWLDTSQAASVGYNILRVAGSPIGRTHSAEARKKISIAHTGKIIPAEARLRMALAKLGTRATEETRAKMSGSQRGLKTSDATKVKMAAANLGRRHTDESRAKMSASQRARILSPEAMGKMLAAHIGRKASQETRDRMSEARKGRKWTPEQIARKMESTARNKAAKELA